MFLKGQVCISTFLTWHLLVQEWPFLVLWHFHFHSRQERGERLGNSKCLVKFKELCHQWAKDWQAFTSFPPCAVVALSAKYKSLSQGEKKVWKFVALYTGTPYGILRHTRCGVKLLWNYLEFWHMYYLWRTCIKCFFCWLKRWHKASRIEA